MGVRRSQDCSWYWFLALRSLVFMDGSCLLLQSLDSLWFFTNVFSSKTGSIADASDSNATNEEEDPTKPVNPVVETHKNDSLTPKCLKCGDFDTKMEVGNPTTIEESKKRNRRRRRSMRKILAELDLGYAGSYYRDCRCGVFDEEKRGYGMLGSLENMQAKMPPLSDGIAMKKHIKSWAYAVAVACTVR